MKFFFVAAFLFASNLQVYLKLGPFLIYLYSALHKLLLLCPIV